MRAYVVILIFVSCSWGFSKKYEIKINEHSLLVELAVTQEQRQKGLMYRNHLHENEGMLFVFPYEDYHSFWMKNTFIPLDIGFFDKEGFLTEVQTMKPNTEKTYTPSEPIMYAVEVNSGWFAKRNLKKYSKLHLTNEVKEKIKELQKKD
ncbi:MAG: DUF192 domain-containing protein [Leptospiraceae bacterium]|nr:DUF192 domain-containing protein [Leptospiraceae bacterium]MDW7976755.1 DUF192 domain-containing protein [Leptospiraceae bacterium]